MSVEQDMRELALRQHGVVSTAQATALGADWRWRSRRIDAGVWVKRTPRVLAVGGAPDTTRTAMMTAVLDAGTGAFSSHRMAAVVWDLPGFGLSVPEVASPRPRARHSGPVVQHRSRLLLPHHLTEVTGIPVTTLPRTIFDLAGTDLPLGRLARLIDTDATRSPATLLALHRLLPELATRGRTGIGRMRVLLDERPAGEAVPASSLERRFEEILRHAGERPFERQVDLGGHTWLGRVDFWDREAKILAEVDSELHHTSLVDRTHDALRDQAMREAGVREILRLPEDHLWHEPWRVVEAVRVARRAAA